MNRKLLEAIKNSAGRIAQWLVKFAKRFTIFLVSVAVVVVIGALLEFVIPPLPAISQQTRTLAIFLSSLATILAGALAQAIWNNFVYPLTQHGRPPLARPRLFWGAFILAVIIGAGLGALASTAPSPLQPAAAPPRLPTPSASTAGFPQPSTSEILTGFTIAGYSKELSLVRSSQGRLSVFVASPNGDLALSESADGGHTWSKPSVFDRVPGPQLSATIDSADRIHAVWGHAPEAGDAVYGPFENGRLVTRTVVGTGVFARDIAVDSSNHPHIIWSNVDIYETMFDGQNWTTPERRVQGGWHPDIQIDGKDNVFLFMNNGNFYPAPEVSVYEKDNTGGSWNKAVRISTSPFWSGGAAAALERQSTPYVVWIGADSQNGGSDQVFFSRYVEGEWQTPFPVGNVNTSAGSTGEESPSVAFDGNGVYYVFWRGLTDKKRPAIFVRALVTENSSVTQTAMGWSPIVQLDDPNASDVGWPSVADVQVKNRLKGVDVVWNAKVGTGSVIDYSHVTYP